MAALLVDEGIGRDVAQLAVAQGYTVVHWLDIGAKHTHDAVLFWQAQQRGLTLFTLNRKDFVFAATCWQTWGLGDHHGIIAPQEGRQPLKSEQLQAMLRYCADPTSFINRVDLF